MTDEPTTELDIFAGRIVQIETTLERIQASNNDLHAFFAQLRSDVDARHSYMKTQLGTAGTALTASNKAQFSQAQAVGALNNELLRLARLIHRLFQGTVDLAWVLAESGDGDSSELSEMLEVWVTTLEHELFPPIEVGLHTPPNPDSGLGEHPPIEAADLADESK